MRRTQGTLTVLLVVACWGVSAQQPTTPPAPKAKAAAEKTGGAANPAKIRDAMSAAPADVAKNATIMDWPEKPGAPMKQLRAGTNGWMCMPTTGAGGGVGADPMCLDKTFSAWADAYMNKKDPPQATTMGTAYMLRGDKGASNTDPFAEAPTPTNQWVVTGPHVMVLLPNPSQLDAYSTDPHGGGPFVMWKGTKYAHLMIPISSMSKSAASKGAPPK
jgi:hypothetical protein